MKSPRVLVSLLNIVVGASQLAYSREIDTSGAIEQCEPPTNLGTGQLENSTKILLFAEQVGVKATQAIKVDISKPGTSPKNGALPKSVSARDANGKSKPAKVNANLSRKTVPRGTVVNSYLVHFDPVGSAEHNQTAKGTVTFDEEILGLIVTAPNLNTAHSFLGHPNTAYPQSSSQEVDFTKDGTSIVLSKDMKTLALTLVASTESLNIRVITRAGGGESRERPTVRKNENVPGGDVLQGRSAWSGTRTDVNHNVNSNCNINIIAQNGKVFTLVYCEHHCNIKVTMEFLLRGNELICQSWKNQSVGDWKIENMKVGLASTDGQGMEIAYSWVQSGGRKRIQNAIASGTISVTRDR